MPVKGSSRASLKVGFSTVQNLSGCWQIRRPLYAKVFLLSFCPRLALVWASLGTSTLAARKHRIHGQGFEVNDEATSEWATYVEASCLWTVSSNGSKQHGAHQGLHSSSVGIWMWSESVESILRSLAINAEFESRPLEHWQLQKNREKAEEIHRQELAKQRITWLRNYSSSRPTSAYQVGDWVCVWRKATLKSRHKESNPKARYIGPGRVAMMSPMYCPKDALRWSGCSWALPSGVVHLNNFAQPLNLRSPQWDCQVGWACCASTFGTPLTVALQCWCCEWAQVWPWEGPPPWTSSSRWRGANCTIDRRSNSW